MPPLAVAHAARRRRPLVHAAGVLALVAAAPAPATAQTATTTSTTTAAAPAPPPAPAAEPTTARPRGGTYRGMRGGRVRSLQRTLEQLGLPVGVDGSFGPATERAVRRYEREESVKEDGAVSTAQLKGMRKRATPRRTVRRYASRTLRPGVRGTDVRAVQRVLVDLGVPTPRHGVFTEAIAQKVRTWETSAGMAADGLVGAAQAKKMQAALPDVRLSDGAAPAPAAVAAPADGAQVFPIRGPFTWGGPSTSFGDRGGAHQGTDVFAACGTPLVAAEGGEVLHNQTQSAAGNYLVVRGARSGEDQAYMHLQARSPLKEGDTVATGGPIGVVGATGNADGCHLHFETWTSPGWYEGGKPRDPEPDLRAWAAREDLEAAAR